MSKATHLLVGNPTAQSGKNAARIERAMRLFADAGVGCELLATAPHGKTIGLVAEAVARSRPRCVVSMGGDGTFREVASGLLESGWAEQVVMAMLPTGTANDQGRSFGLSADEDQLPRNVAVVIAGKETRLDAGRITTFDEGGAELTRAHFFDSAGWGLSARVLAERNRDRAVVEKLPGVKHVYRDQLVYAGAMLKNLAESYVVNDKFVAHVVADGKAYTLTKLSDLVIKATRVYGGEWVFDPTSRHDDGLFEIVPARGRRDWAARVLSAFDGSSLPADALDALGIATTEIVKAAHIELTFELPVGGAPFAGQIDGEELKASRRAHIDVIARPIRLVVP